MSTRSLTHIHEIVPGKSPKTPLLTFYRQSDGYPSGHGAELAEFLDGFTIVNGLGGQSGKIANGVGCLAAQLIAHFKTEPGHIYIYPAGSKNCDEEYTYRVRAAVGQPIILEVYETSGGYEGKPLKNKLIRIGSPQEIFVWAKKQG
jgi:hypothetical protein